MNAPSLTTVFNRPSLRSPLAPCKEEATGFKGDGGMVDIVGPRDSAGLAAPCFDRIPLYSPLYRGVWGEGLVTVVLPRLFLPPPQSHNMTRAIGFKRSMLT